MNKLFPESIKRQPGKIFLITISTFALIIAGFVQSAFAVAPNTPAISSPAASSSHTGGDFINFAGTCTDTEDGSLSGSAMIWTSSKDGQIGTGESININSLQSGVHTITLTATDSESLSSNTSISITVLNNAPTASITTPTNGSTFNAGSSVTFTGTGTDMDAGDTLSYSWSSTIGGSTSIIGTSSIIATSSLAVGTHVIVLTVSDGKGGSTPSIPITIDITNNAPVAAILSPASSDTFYSGTTINFNGTGTDAEDASGALTYTWSCSEHGAMSSSPSFTDSTLVDGNHTITFTVTDTQGTSNIVPQIITIHVGNYVPVPTITAPANGTSYDMDDVIVFMGSATDTEDGNLSGSSLVWTSSIDGSIGTGTTVTSSSLASGTHIITLTATDNYVTTPGTGTDSIIITVSNTFPAATISNPADNSSFYENASITFSGAGTDAEDGILSGAALAWTSSLDGPIGTGSPMTNNALSVGTHSITLTATDSESAATISNPITITIGNTAPVALITAPVDGSSYNRGDTVTFRGTGTDNEDGTLTGPSLTWTSNIAGSIGTGTILPVSTLTTGTHTITLTASDSQSITGNISIAITINNNPPVVTIHSPPDNSIYELGTAISFTGTASDPEDGFITGADLVWSSSIDGLMGTGTSISSTLTKGTHIITLTATDSESDNGSVNLTVHVGNNPPTVSITTPADGTNFDTGEYITFQGLAADTEDGTLSGASLVWTSSKDGNFATGLSPSQINTLSTGQHAISLIATDSNGAVTYSTPVTIRIGNLTPVATILNPANNETFENGETITFEGTGIDAEDGVLLTTSLVWTSSRQGQIGTGTSFSTTTLDAGEHTITLTATDVDGASQSLSIVIFAQNQRPVVTINNPASGVSIDEGNTITFQGSATDSEDGTISGAALVWTSNFDGTLGTGTTFSHATLSSGTHTITLTATDSRGATNAASITLTIVPMTLSVNILEIDEGDTGTIIISGGKMPYRVATRRSQIALPTENNGSVEILGVSEGATIVTVTDNNKSSAMVSVTVTEDSGGTGSQLPDAYAGPDQSEIEENESVYLTGSNANLQSEGSDSFLWTQTDPAAPGTVLTDSTVVLTDYTSATPSFIAPLIDLNGQQIAFRLTVTNQAGSDTDTVTITLKANGITEYPGGTVTFKSSTDKSMGAKSSGSGQLKILNAIDPADMNISTLPQSILYGLIDFKMVAPAAGETVSLVIYMPDAAPDGYKWFKYIESEDTWVDFDRNLISSGTGDGAVFSDDRTNVTLYITDDGRYDDNKSDMIVEDPSGLAKPPIGNAATNSGSGSDDSSNGCFLNTIGDF